MPDNATLSSAPDAATAMAFLQALSAGGDKAASPETLFKTLAAQSGDPTTSMLASLLLNGLGEAEEDEASGDEADEIERLLAFAETGEDRSGARGMAADGELDALREVNDTLAAALGACPKCWGGDERCDACDGEGGPGSSVPDQHLFTELILPAVRRINQTRRARPDPTERRRRSETKEVHHGQA